MNRTPTIVCAYCARAGHASNVCEDRREGEKPTAERRERLVIVETVTRVEAA